MDASWTEISLVLAGEVIFASGVAYVTRYFTRTHLEGQTYWLVVVGVTGVIAIASPLIGWQAVVILAAAFAVAAIPMGIEYFSRVARESTNAVDAQVAMVEGDDDE